MRTDPLLVHYPVRLRLITVFVLLGFSIVFYFYPRFLGEAKKIGGDDLIIEIETFDIPQTQQFKLPEPPARPSVPVASEDEFLDEDITIEETEFDQFEEWDAPPPPASSGPQVVFIPFEEPPRPKTPIRPVYPDIAREAGIEGVVYVQAFIDKNGNVTQVVVAKGIPNTGLDEAAVDAVKRTRWKPALQRDKKIGVWYSIPIRFTLTEN
ncbi:MAG: energy transducer TonB [Candidatus Marinimicrobia bacterium]|nr:energy transducer TonB [Candidatus Neomarinimicrobiota bacterium]MBL7108992.1 energy transducer TonB [Candidatus Neomarinimicrobiota bacterium]